MGTKIGNGSIRAVEAKSERHPSYKGSLTVNGTKFWLSGWKKKGDDGSTYLSLSVETADGDTAQSAADKPF